MDEQSESPPQTFRLSLEASLSAAELLRSLGHAQAVRLIMALDDEVASWEATVLLQRHFTRLIDDCDHRAALEVIANKDDTTLQKDLRELYDGSWSWEEEDPQ